MAWIKITLTKRPFVDANGKVLASIEGRRNREGIDEFSGGGWDGHPDIDESQMQERYRKGNIVIIKTDAAVSRGELLTDEQAEEIKRDVFGIGINLLESGVTE